MTNAGLLLADRVLRERPKIDQLEILRRDIVKRLGNRACERYAFDDAASDMIGRMGAQLPEKMKALIAIARPACGLVWIEWNHKSVRRAGLDAGVRELEDSDAEYIRRTGVLVEHYDTEMLFLFCQENNQAGTLVEMMFWPIGYLVSTTNGLTPPWTKPDLSRRKADNLARRTWGYGMAAKMSPLRGLAAVVTTPGTSLLRRHDDEGIMDAAIKQAAVDLMGVLRMGVAALAVLNAVGEVSAVTRPPGVIRGGGELKPYVPRRLVTVQVPKHRTPLSYARSRILAHHKRLHEVRSHWRHLSHEPQAPGWQRVEIDGRTLWRKAIARHLRGNPDLGVVEHAGARVTGPHT